MSQYIQGIIYLSRYMLHKIWYISLRVISILSYYFQIKSSILLENHVSCNFLLKYYITVSIRQFTKHFNEFFVLIWGKRKFEICISQKYKIAFSLKTAAYDCYVIATCILQWNSYSRNFEKLRIPQFFLHLT